MDTQRPLVGRPGVGGEDAVAVPDLDQAVTRKLLDDLAGRGAADPELGGQ
nr:hypothetical protein [Pseudonocardia sp. EC080625-04]